MLDVFFISWDEPNAEEHYNMIVEKAAHAVWVKGIKGIHKAHLTCAKMSFTPNFYVVDADTIVKDTFNFSFIPPEWDVHYTHIWRAANPFNQLAYGYGGIKLFSKEKVLAFEHKKMPTDFSTSVSEVKIMEEVASTTAFNSSPFHTWRSSFRECAKLASKNDEESKERLKTWLTVWNPCVQYAKEYYEGGMHGAKIGYPYCVYAVLGYESNELSDEINNFERLKETYDEYIRSGIDYQSWTGATGIPER